MGGVDTSLRCVLERARSLGFLGPGEVDAHVRQAEAFAAAVPEPPSRALDLGSGGGVPGLVLACRWPASRWMLLDANQRRTEFLSWAVGELGLVTRADVVRQRAEEAGRRPEFRGAFELVTSRSFGPPAVVAECGAPFLEVGGRLVVSEPPDPHGLRWPDIGLAQLGLERGPRPRTGEGSVQVMVLVRPCPQRFPRRAGMPAKRPLY